MTDFVFADRYAEAGIAPTAEMIASRQSAADRITNEIEKERILDLVGVYFGSPGLDLTWFRNEFAEDDTTFSLVNNEREVRVLASAILGALISKGDSTAILAVTTGYCAGRRQPKQCEWLIRDALAALNHKAIENRRTSKIETKITSSATAKLAEEITGYVDGDWPGLKALLTKMRADAQAGTRSIASQTSLALQALNHQLKLQREESQMLWWLTSGFSRSLERNFADIGLQQAAVIAAIDLGALTTVTHLGPVAAPAILDRVIRLAKRPKGALTKSLSTAIDGISGDDLKRLSDVNDDVPRRLTPISTAIYLASTIGVEIWHAKFKEITGLEAGTEFDPLDLATQLYREHLLGQLV